MNQLLLLFAVIFLFRMIDNTNAVRNQTLCSSDNCWSDWSKWSKCREGTQKRRRKCKPKCEYIFDCPVSKPRARYHSIIVVRVSSPRCIGLSFEKRSCPYVPSFAWGEWSEWNEWSECTCQQIIRKRTRHCLAQSCEGCGIEYGECEKNEEYCPEVKRLGDWTEWQTGTQENVLLRVRPWCSLKINKISIGLKREMKKNNQTETSWSSWDVRHGVAIRYRLDPSKSPSSISIQHQLLSTTVTSNISIHWTISLCILCLIIGFISQNIIFYSCRRKKTKCHQIT